MSRILVIDNYDSFVFNLVQYLGQLGAECIVKRNDEVSVEEAGEYDGVLISPGPGTPEEAGISIAMIKYCADKNIPLFGVCLGHQAIGVAFGATVSRAEIKMRSQSQWAYLRLLVSALKLRRFINCNCYWLTNSLRCPSIRCLSYNYANCLRCIVIVEFAH